MLHRSALACWLVLPVVAAGADPVPVARLIDQLGDRDFRRRESAGKLLADRGESILPELRTAQPHADSHVRKRLDEIIQEIERHSLLTPRLVTLHAENGRVNDLLNELTRQTGYRFSCPGGTPGQLVTLHADDQPFWVVLDQVCQQSGLALQPHHDGSGAFMLYRQQAFCPHVCYQGAFRLAAVNFHYYKQMNLGNLQTNNPFNRQRTETLTFAFSVTAEPKVPLLGLGQPQIVHATDDAGRSLVPNIPRNPHSSHYPGFFGYRNTMLQTQVQLAAPGEGRLIPRLQGSVPVTVLAEQKPEITIDRVTEAKDRKAEGRQVSLEIHDVKPDANNGCRVTATARRAGPENLHDYSWTNSLQQRVELQDAEGRKFLTQGFNWETGTPTTVRGTFTFTAPSANGNNNGQKVGKPYRLVFYSWTTAPHQLEFEFRDLPLP